MSVQLHERGSDMPLSRRTLWIGAILLTVAVVVLIAVYAGGAGSGGGGGY
jgi:hypothetical protein